MLLHYGFMPNQAVEVAVNLAQNMRAIKARKSYAATATERESLLERLNLRVRLQLIRHLKHARLIFTYIMSARMSDYL